MTATLVILGLLLALNAMLAASELAMMTSRPSRLQQMADRGNVGARKAIEMSREPTRLLSTVQVGITLVAVFQGAYGERQLTGPIAEWVKGFEPLEHYSEGIALAIVVALLTYCSLVFGELVPKRVALAYPERVATLIAPFLWIVSTVAAWPVRLLSASTDGLLRLMRIRQRPDEVNEEDVKAIVARAASTGVFDPIEHRIFERALRVGDMTAKSLMVPRSQITWIDESMPAEDVRILIGTAPFSHFPVCGGTIDRLRGVVHVKDLISYGLLAGSDFKVSAVMQPPAYVPDTMPALKLLELFQAKRTRIAFVVDEHGGLEGLATANDVIQAILGDLSRGGEDEQPAAVRRDDGSWLIDGRLPLPDVLATLGIGRDAPDELPEVATAAGLVTALLGDLPATGDHVDWHGWRFEVVDLDGRRVDKVLVSRLPRADRASR
ncbi:MAG: HlyC/CorC family transporter [Phycisphaerales bacterium]|nr:HlyC/CorC family transporter [Phycisphaerales bacterium]